MPTRSPEGIRNVATALQSLGVDHLITIGGDDTCYSASHVAKAVPGLTVAHVPKTIDNDLPLPGDVVTFGFTTACNLGKELVRNLMQDAATTERWFFVPVRAGHASISPSVSAAGGGHPHLIAEEFRRARERGPARRQSSGRHHSAAPTAEQHGVALLSEAGEKLDLAILGDVERDAYGNVRLAELDLGQILKERVSASLKARGVDVTIVAKDMGYELRCAAPGAHDIQYSRSLGYWATRFLLEGGSNAMVTIQAGRLVPIPFGLMLDPKSGKIRVRYVDMESEMYQTLWAYMIRLKTEDLEDPETGGALAKAGISRNELMTRFGSHLR